MSAIVVSLVLAVCILLIVLALAGGKIASLFEEIGDDRTVDHAKCIAHIASVVSDRFIATAFRDAAERWDSVEEKPLLHRLSRVYVPGGPPMPTIWLNHLADQLDPPKAACEHEHHTLYTLDGSGVHHCCEAAEQGERTEA